MKIRESTVSAPSGHYGHNKTAATVARLSALDEQRRQTMVDCEIETSTWVAIVQSMELGLAVQGLSTGEIDEDSARRIVAMD
jgi:hypothetical protein